MTASGTKWNSSIYDLRSTTNDLRCTTYDLRSYDPNIQTTNFFFSNCQWGGGLWLEGSSACRFGYISELHACHDDCPTTHAATKPTRRQRAGSEAADRCLFAFVTFQAKRRLKNVPFSRLPNRHKTPTPKHTATHGCARAALGVIPCTLLSVSDALFNSSSSITNRAYHTSSSSSTACHRPHTPVNHSSTKMEALRQVFHDFTSFGAGQAGSSEMDSAKFVKFAKVKCSCRVQSCTYDY